MVFHFLYSTLCDIEDSICSVEKDPHIMVSSAGTIFLRRSHPSGGALLE
jgi:hypothetical protein